VGLWLFSAFALLAWVGLASVKTRWRTTWSVVAARL
jgi:NNP family nitrate/nitrite transporter-like MFS transporter